MYYMNLLLAFVTGGNCKSQFALTRHTFERYADKIGAKLIVDTTRYYHHAPQFNQLYANDYLDSYDRVCVIDCDIMIRKDTPDIFEVVPPGMFGAVNEGILCDEKEWAFRYKHARDVAALTHTVCPDPWVGPYYNCGVYVIDRQHRIPHPDPVPRVGMADQSYINCWLQNNDIPTFDLPRQFNMFSFHAEEGWERDGYLLHTPGMDHPEKMALLQRFLELHE